MQSRMACSAFPLFNKALTHVRETYTRTCKQGLPFTSFLNLNYSIRPFIFVTTHQQFCKNVFHKQALLSAQPGRLRLRSCVIETLFVILPQTSVQSLSINICHPFLSSTQTKLCFSNKLHPKLLPSDCDAD